MYSSTYTAVIVNVLSFILPQMGIEVGSEQLTTTLQTIVAVATGLWILIERWKKGGVNALGFRQ